ncbi:MAG: mevalonate kinase [Armatimonadota bacterium]
MPDIALQVPGRICLFGDKIDIAHKPVIAAAIDMFMQIEAEALSARRVVLYSHDFDSTEALELGAAPDTSAHMKYVQAVAWLLRDRLPTGFSMRVRSGIPIGAGLSTSAALTVGALMALDRLFGLGMSRDEMAEVAYVAEHDVCGISCGRMDQYAIAHGGVTFITTGEPASAEVLPIDELPVVIGDSAEPRHASEVLNRTRDRLHAGDPVVLDAFARLHHYTLSGREALVAGDGARVGELMNLSQIEEKRIGASTETIERLCTAAVAAGAHGAKQMGAGGGGCMVAYCPGHQDAVAAAIEAEGGVPYVCNVFRWPEPTE